MGQLVDMEGSVLRSREHHLGVPVDSLCNPLRLLLLSLLQAIRLVLDLQCAAGHHEDALDIVKQRTASPISGRPFTLGRYILPISGQVVLIVPAEHALLSSADVLVVLASILLLVLTALLVEQDGTGAVS